MWQTNMISLFDHCYYFSKGNYFLSASTAVGKIMNKFFYIYVSKQVIKEVIFLTFFFVIFEINLRKCQWKVVKMR